MALIWHLILRYQIGKSKAPPKKLMLSWMQAIMPDLGITNFSTDWNDGIALHALIEYCRPGTCPKWRQLSRRDGLANCQAAMALARQEFGIPLVVSPEDLSSPDLDELSGMTYLSYYMKLHSPGYNATLRWVQGQIPDNNVNDFQTGWNDGSALTALVRALGGDVHDTNINTTDHEGRLGAAMTAAQGISVEPVISAKEMADPEVDHLGVMAYAAWFQHARAGSLKAETTPVMAPAPPPPPRTPTPPPPPPPRTAPEDMLNVLWRRQDVYLHKPVTLDFEAQDELTFDPAEVSVDVIGPRGTRPHCKVTWAGGQGRGVFVPQEPGVHKVVVHYADAVVRGCPLDLDAQVDVSSVRLKSPLGASFTGKPTAIQISAKDAARGAVKVEARAPSGRVHEMSVVDNNGVYTANFTPGEVGEWQVAIKYEGAHIQGSPFNVRVYDASQVKVYGLQGGAVGKTFGFTVDTSGAGEGELTVNIVHNGRIVPANITHDPASPGRFTVNFTPDGSGVYTIKVFFSGIQVTGSPYTLEIVDSSQVTASGKGLSSVEINRRAEFIVNTGHPTNSGDLLVDVTAYGPRGNKIPSTIRNIDATSFAVEYVPSDVGEYIIDVSFYGRPIKGSPFKAQAFDWSRITVSNLKETGLLGRPVEFDIDASAAGSGNLEIMVNDGTIPCSVQNRGNRQFHASFVPKEAKSHFIQMRFNSREVPGSPWRVDILSAASVSASGNGLQLVPVNAPTKFEVRTGVAGYNGEIAVNITAPSRRPIPAQVMNIGGGNFSVEYVPNEVGNYTVEVLYESMPIPGSPFTSKAYDAASIVVSSIPNGTSGKPVEFTIDVTQAGEGQLEIMVNRGAVPNSVRMMRKGVFLVSFVPRDTRPHTVDIKFNGQLLPYSPITVPIMDTSRVTVQGEGLRQVAVNRQSFFRVNTASAGDADLAVRVTSPNGDLVPAKIVQQPDGDYKVEYSSRYTGRHTVEILYAGQAIMGSPFYVEIYDPNKIRVEGTRSGIVGQRMEFDIVNNEAGRAELGMSITSPSGRNVPFDVKPGALGDHVVYMPTEPGPHQIFLTYGGLEVPGTPITQTIMDAGSAAAFGDGLKFAHQDQASEFYVDTQGRQGNLDVQVDGPNSIAKVNIKPDVSGKYLVTYVPVEVGVYNVNIRWNGRPIEGSPYTPRVVDARRVTPVGGWEAILDQQDRMTLKVNQRNRIEFDTRQAGPGEMRAEVKGPEGQIPVDVEGGNGTYSINFIPRVPGDYYVKVYWGEIALSRCPIYAVAGAEAALSHDKVVLTGHGLVEGRVNAEAEFVVDGSEAGPGSPEVRLTGVKDHIDVRVVPLGGNKYKAVYVPTAPGAYLLSIMWSDRQVRGSPFKVNVLASSDASKVAVSGDGIRGGVFGKEIKAVIDTRRAGPGELTAHCMGPQKVAYCELYDHRDGTFTLNIKPQESGKHLLQVKYGGEHVPGSPFTLRVAGAPDASKVRVSGPGVEAGILATYQSRFITETRGAGAGQLTVRIRGPKGAFRVEMSRESQKDRTILCRYDPTEVGDYIISVKWSGDHVPGSPFHVNILDTNEELERFLMENPQRRQNLPIAGPDRHWSEDL